MPRIIDLSLEIYNDGPSFPGDPEVSITPRFTTVHDDFNLVELKLGTHVGTHMDAPFHFIPGARTIDRVDLSRGFGLAHVLDFHDKPSNEPVTRGDLEAHADKIIKGARIIIRRDWDKVFPAERYYTGCPGVSPDACRYLVERGIACVGLDTFTIDRENSTDVHRILLGAEILIVEGLANLWKLTEETILFTALPLKLKDCDGSPCRAIAVEGLASDVLAAFQA